MNGNPNKREHRHPIMRAIGHVLGLLYILITLLFGPIKWLANWLRQQAPVQRYRSFISGLPPAGGLTAAFLSIASLELSKIAVFETLTHYGLFAAILAAIATKASLGFFAHTTWHAARHKVITTYPWMARIDTWVSRMITQLKTFRAHFVTFIKSSFWWPDAVDGWMWLRQRTAPVLESVFQKMRK